MDAKTLKAFSLTCRTHHSSAVPSLFSHIHVEMNDSFVDFVTTVRDRPELTGHIRSLSFSFEHGSESIFEAWPILPVLHQCTTVRLMQATYEPPFGMRDILFLAFHSLPHAQHIELTGMLASQWSPETGYSDETCVPEVQHWPIQTQQHLVSLTLHSFDCYSPDYPVPEEHKPFFDLCEPWTQCLTITSNSSDYRTTSFAVLPTRPWPQLRKLVWSDMLCPDNVQPSIDVLFPALEELVCDSWALGYRSNPDAPFPPSLKSVRIYYRSRLNVAYFGDSEEASLIPLVMNKLFPQGMILEMACPYVRDSLHAELSHACSTRGISFHHFELPTPPNTLP